MISPAGFFWIFACSSTRRSSIPAANAGAARASRTNSVPQRLAARNEAESKRHDAKRVTSMVSHAVGISGRPPRGIWGNASTSHWRNTQSSLLDCGATTRARGGMRDVHQVALLESARNVTDAPSRSDHLAAGLPAAQIESLMRRLRKERRRIVFLRRHFHRMRVNRCVVRLLERYMASLKGVKCLPETASTEVEATHFGKGSAAKSGRLSPPWRVASRLPLS